MYKLSLRLLGGVWATLNGAVLSGFNSDKCRGLLAYLAVEADRPHRRENLAGLLWPEISERSARHNLSQALYNVRTLIGDRDTGSSTAPFLETDYATVQFIVSTNLWLDVKVLDQAMKTSRSDTRAIEVLRQAETLYQGEFLAGFSLPDSPQFEEWILIQRERFHRIIENVLGTLAAYYEDKNEVGEAINYAWQLVALDPWRETAQRRLIHLLALDGQRDTALVQYEICRNILTGELGIEPEPETVALADDIRSGRLSQIVPAKTTSLKRVIPESLIPWIGRAEEIHDLTRRLRRDECRLLTLVGPGGIGKTALALELLRSMLPHFEHGVFFIRLTDTQDIQAIHALIAEVIGLTPSEESSLIDELVKTLKTRKVLICLDNFEHLLGGLPLITELIRATRHVKFLVTSRVRLGSIGESVYHVSGLGLPSETADSDEIRASDAVKLFVRMAQRQEPHFQLNLRNAESAARICRQVQGYPLALILAASWSDVCPISEIAERIAGHLPVDCGEQGLAFLSTNMHDIPARHTSMTVVFEQSWKLLLPEEQFVLCGLAVFRSGFTSDAAYYVAGATLRDLKKLSATSWIQNPNQDSRQVRDHFHIHPLIRQYIEEHLRAIPQTEAMNLHNRHLQFYSGLMKRCFRKIQGAQERDGWAELDREIDNIWAAWDWAVKQGDLATIAEYARFIVHYCANRSQVQEGYIRLKNAVEHIRSLRISDTRSSPEYLQVMVRCQVEQGFLAPRIMTEKLILQSLAILQGSELSTVDTRYERAEIASLQGQVSGGIDRQTAIPHFQCALNLYRELGDSWYQMLMLWRLGDYTWSLGNYHGAQQYYQQSLDMANVLGNRTGKVNALTGLGAVAILRGKIQYAIRIAEDLVVACRSIGDPFQLQRSLYPLGLRLTIAGRYKEAAKILNECVQLGEDSGYAQEYVLSVLGLIAMFQGEYERARELGLRANFLLRENEDLRGIAWTNMIMGGIALAQGYFDEAENKLHESCRIYRDIGQVVELCQALGILSCTLANRCIVEGHCTAETHNHIKILLLEGLEIYLETGIQLPLDFLFIGAEQFLYLDENLGGAVSVDVTLHQHFKTLTVSQWYADVTGLHLRQYIDINTDEKPRGFDSPQAAVLALVEILDLNSMGHV